MMNLFSFSLFLVYLLHGRAEAFAPSSRFSVVIHDRIHSHPTSSGNFLAGTLIDSGDVTAPNDRQDRKKYKLDKNITSVVAEDKDFSKEISEDLILDDETLDEQTILDIDMMQKAIQIARSR